MKSVNKVILIGTMGRDPEMRYAVNNTVPVVSFSIATNERFKYDQGNWQDRTEWHKIVAWRRLAEIIGQYVKKGDRIYIEGKLQTRSWQDKNTNEKKYMTEVVADDLVLIGGRREGSGGGPGDANAAHATAGGGSHFDQRPPDEVHEVSAGTGITDEDIPF